MIRLPFRPDPYPDEMLCSWLARIAFHNGTGTWRSLLEATDNGAHLGNPMLHMPSYSHGLESLLNALGTSYMPAMMRMTTLPYWLTFQATMKMDEPLKNACSPAQLVRIQSGKHRTRGIHRVGTQRFSKATLHARLCPKCLDLDCQLYGEPYWHRSHQLPNVFSCSSHGCPLLSTCPSCKHTIVPSNSQLLGLPKLRCHCGYRLTQPPPDHTSTPTAYVKLIKMSVDALNNGYPQWGQTQTHDYFQQKIIEKRGDMYGSYSKLLCATFNTSRNALGEALTLRLHPESVVRFHPYFSTASTPDYCALAVALGLDLEQISKELPTSIVQLEYNNEWPSKKTCGKLTIDIARQEMLRFAKAKACPVSSHRVIYWFLKLFDDQWLSEHFRVLPIPIPSIIEDRERMAQLLAKASGLRRDIRRRLIISLAGIRASFRDQDWLENNIHEFDKQKKACRQTQTNELLDFRSSQLKQALQQLLENECWPIRVTRGLLGQMVGLSSVQTQDAARNDPELQAAINVANQTKPKRQIIWAVRQLQSEGRLLTLKQILRRARLPTFIEFFNIAREVRGDSLFSTNHPNTQPPNTRNASSS